MSKRRSLERGAGETSGRASKLLCPGIAGSNAKRAGPFILGKRWGLLRGKNGKCWPLTTVFAQETRKEVGGIQLA